MSDDWATRCAREIVKVLWDTLNLEKAPLTKELWENEIAAHIRRHAPKAGLQQCPHCYTTLFNAESDSESPEAVKPGGIGESRCLGQPSSEGEPAIAAPNSCYDSESTPPRYDDVFFEGVAALDRDGEPEPLEAVVERACKMSQAYPKERRAEIMLHYLRPCLAARDLKQLEGQADYIRKLERERDRWERKANQYLALIQDKYAVQIEQMNEATKARVGAIAERDALRTQKKNLYRAVKANHAHVESLQEAVREYAITNAALREALEGLPYGPEKLRELEGE